MAWRCRVAGRAAAACGLAAVPALDFWWPDALPENRRPDGTVDSYWATVCKEKPVARAALPAGAKEDTRVCIVGGGMAGLHTALSLAERGVPSVILEARRVGWGASGLSNGQVIPGVQVEGEDLARVVGDSTAARIEQLTHSAQKLLLYRIQKFGIECDVEQRGSVVISVVDGGQDCEGNDAAPLEVWDRERTQSVVGSPLALDGLFDPRVWAVNPLALTVGLARAAEHEGVRIYEQTEAVATRRGSGGKWVVESASGGTVTCDDVVFCGAAHLRAGLSRRVALATVPVFTWMVSTEPLSAAQKATINNGCLEKVPVVDNNLVSLNYWRFMRDGRLIFGGLAHAFPLPSRTVERKLRAQLEEHYPQLAGIGIEHVWGGTLAFALHACPILGRDGPNGPWFASGFGGHGIVPTCMAGELIAGGIAGGDDRWMMMQKKLPPTFTFWPFSRLGAELVLRFFQALDRLRLRGVPLPESILPSKPW